MENSKEEAVSTYDEVFTITFADYIDKMFMTLAKMLYVFCSEVY